MEDIHNFTGGMHTDFDEQNQPKNTYRDSFNWIRSEDGSLSNERGTQLINLPEGAVVVGLHALEEEVVVFSYTEEEVIVGGEPTLVYQYGEIGVVDSSNNYSTISAAIEYQFKNTKIKAESRVDYRGHRIIYYIDIYGTIPATRVDLDSPPLANIEEESKLFLNTSLPSIDVVSVTEDGSLPTGIYQFSSRLLTSSLNKSAVSFMTNVVPIVNESISGSTESYDGALPQTPSFKSINLEVTNIDTKFKFLEIIATTYDGLTNTPKSNVITTKLITGTTMTHKYSSLDENGEEVLLDEITVEPISLDNPKAITQKDGHLLFGNLEAKRYDYNFQSIANNSVIKYIIKDFDYTENVNINSSYSSVNTGGGIDIGLSTSQFNNYKLELNTTDFRGYRRGEVYSFAIVPLFKNGTFGNAYHIPSNSSSSAADTTTKVLGKFTSQDNVYPSGYGYPSGNVTYHRMPTIQQESTYLSGKIRVLGVKVEYDLSTLSSEERDNIIGVAIVRELRTEANKSILAQGLATPFYIHPNGNRVVAPWAGKEHWRYGETGNYTDDMVAFYSPETCIYRDNVASATNLVSLATMYGESKLVADKFADTGDSRFAHAMLNYNTISTHTPVSSALNKSYTQYVNPNSGVTDIQGTKIDSNGTNGYVLLKGNSVFDIYDNPLTKDKTGGIAEMAYEYLSGTDVMWFKNLDGNMYNTGGGTYGGETRRNLFNLVSTKPNQYGGVLDKEYVLVDYKYLDGVNSLECYGGDTFINKTAIVTTTKLFQGTIDLDARTLNYFFCESSINTAYRHHVIGSDGLSKTVDYYPHRRRLYTNEGDGLLQFLPEYGHANGYNKQYSFENILKKFYSKSQFTEEEVTRFSNRVIYSEQAIEGEQFDAYRVFLTNNYHDVPKNKGEITNLFVHQNDLYIHTEQSLWKSSFNERVTQISSAGEVVLGSGGAFSRPSLEMFPHSGGYAGSIDPLATCSTPYGTFFADRLQGKVFLLGSSFEAIEAGLRKNIADWLPYSPFVCSTFDYENDRWLLSMMDIPTLSYYPKLKSFTSQHSYIPSCSVSVNRKVFISHLDELGLLNKGVYGNYFNTDNESMLTIVSNDNPLVSKVFDNIIVNSSAPFSNLDMPNTSYYTLVEDDSWEFEPATGQRRITKQNSEYRIAIPHNFDEKRQKGKSLSLEFGYINSTGVTMIVKYITVKYRINAR